MAKIFLERSGTLPASSLAPLFNDALPSIINPDLRKYIDNFSGAVDASLLNGRALPTAPTAKNWVAVDCLVSGDGYVYPAAGSANARSVISDVGANGEWGITAEHVASGLGRVGIFFRIGTLASDERWFAGISLGSSLAVIERLGPDFNSIETYTAPFATAVGNIHTIRVRVSGSTVELFINGALRLLTNSASELQTQTGVGVAFRGALARIHEFMGGN